MDLKPLLIGAAIITSLVGCSGQAELVAGRDYTAQQVSSGQPLFLQYCAGCHGPQGEGTDDWKRRDAAGNLPPPPLNGSAHTWHHSKELLISTITEGGARWQGTMPAFKDQLTPQQKESVIAYIQSLWSDEIYQRWQHRDRG
jgi:mono/diheme cytochrome c family protein